MKRSFASSLLHSWRPSLTCEDGIAMSKNRMKRKITSLLNVGKKETDNNSSNLTKTNRILSKFTKKRSTSAKLTDIGDRSHFSDDSSSQQSDRSDADLPRHTDTESQQSNETSAIPLGLAEPLETLPLARTTTHRSRRTVQFVEAATSLADNAPESLTEAPTSYCEPAESVFMQPQDLSTYLKMSTVLKPDFLNTKISDAERATLLNWLDLPSQSANGYPRLVVDFAIPKRILKPALGPNAAELNGQSFGVAATLSAYSSRADGKQNEGKREEVLQKEFNKRSRAGRRLEMETSKAEKQHPFTHLFLAPSENATPAETKQNTGLDRLEEDLQEAESALEHENLRHALAIQRNLQLRHQNTSLERENKLLRESNALLHVQIDTESHQLEETASMIWNLVNIHTHPVYRKEKEPEHSEQLKQPKEEEPEEPSGTLQQIQEWHEVERMARLAAEAKVRKLKEKLEVQKWKNEDLVEKLACLDLRDEAQRRWEEVGGGVGNVSSSSPMSLLSAEGSDFSEFGAQDHVEGQVGSEGLTLSAEGEAGAGAISVVADEILADWVKAENVRL